MRVYALKYKFYKSKGGAFKYADQPEYKEEEVFYTRHERDMFIKRYKYLTAPGHIEFGDVKAFVGELSEIVDMQKVIDAV